jgi:glycosyltransferase involved in cell wall biosynthesis
LKDLEKTRPAVLLLLDKMICAGTQRHVLHLLQGMGAEWDFHVVCLEGRGAWDKEVQRLGGHLHIYAMKKIYDLSFLQSLRGLLFLMHRIRPVGMETFMFTAHVTGALASSLSEGLPLISSRREKILWRKNRHRFFRKWANKKVKLHLANSQAVADDIQQQEGVREDKIRILPNGLDWQAYKGNRTIELSREHFHVAVVAAFKPVKKHHLIVEMVDRYRKDFSSVRFHFIGEGPLKEALKRDIVKRSLTEYFIFEGHKDPVAPELFSFDILLSTSISEGLSNSLVEAMGAGLPIVAFDVDGNRELVESQQTGLLSPYASLVSLKEAIVYLFNNKEIRREMGKKACLVAKERYSVEKMCREKTALYKEVFHV